MCPVSVNAILKRFWHLRAWGALLAVFLAGCQPVPLAQPLATPRVLEVNITPALSTMNAAYHQCADELENTGLVLNELPAYAEEPPPATISLRWGIGDQANAGYVAVLGEEELAMIVPVSNPLAEIDLSRLRGLYDGTSVTWPGEGAITAQAWVYPPGDDVQAIFDSTVLGGERASQRAVSSAPDPAAMLEAVAGNPGAVGFVPRAWLAKSDQVKEISITDINPQALRQPVLAFSGAEPVEVEKAWLICLQTQWSK